MKKNRFGPYDVFFEVRLSKIHKVQILWIPRGFDFCIFNDTKVEKLEPYVVWRVRFEFSTFLHFIRSRPYEMNRKESRDFSQDLLFAYLSGFL